MNNIKLLTVLEYSNLKKISKQAIYSKIKRGILETEIKNNIMYIVCDIQECLNNIESIDNYSLLTQTVTKNIKNDNNALLFSNLILKYSNKVSFKDIESEALQKLYTMSLKSQSTLVREIVIHNLQNDVVHLNQFQTLI